MRRLVVSGLLGAALSAALPAQQLSALVQTTDRASPALLQALDVSDSAFRAGTAPRSLAVLEPWLVAEPPDARPLWRAARAHVAFGILSPSRSNAEASYLQALQFARRAVRVAPQDAEAQYWLTVAQGRRALRGDFHRILPLAVETHSAAQRVLQLDSLHAGAHGVLGKLYSEVRKLPWIVRRLAATITRQDVLRLASWERAEHHLHRAIALDPVAVIHRADLVQLYLRMGRLPEARAAHTELMRMANATPADTLFKREMNEALAAARAPR